MQKYLIPKTLVEAADTLDVVYVGLLFKMSLDYQRGIFGSATPYMQELFAPIRAEIDAGKVKPQSKPLEERKESFIETTLLYEPMYGKVMISNFCNYWTEHNEGGKKMKFETHKIFNIKLRLATWHSRSNKTTTHAKQQQPKFSEPIWRR